jgi:hypothetical protein
MQRLFEVKSDKTMFWNSARNVFMEMYGYGVTITKDISITSKYVDCEYQPVPGGFT